MVIRTLGNIILLLACCVTFTFAGTGGVFGVVSHHVTEDNRPLLWLNLNSDEQDVALQFFQGPRYDFVGLVQPSDSSAVFAGLNTAGFGVVITRDQNAADSSNVEAQFIKTALGICGRVEDFISLLKRSVVEDFHSSSSFGCMDAFLNCSVIESNLIQYNVSSPFETPDGYLVRANFAMMGDMAHDLDYWRYHRASELIANGIAENKLDGEYVLQRVARDIAHAEQNPYPLPVDNITEEIPTGFTNTAGAINQFDTRACIVMHGSGQDENPVFATLWAILGEPVCGAAVPVWPANGALTPVVSDFNPPYLNQIIIHNENRLYRHSDFPTYIDTKLLAGGRLSWLLKTLTFEHDLFLASKKSLRKWRKSVNYAQEMLKFQKDAASQTSRALKY